MSVLDDAGVRAASAGVITIACEADLLKVRSALRAEASGPGSA